MNRHRGLRSNKHYVHIDKDRGGEAIVLSPIIRDRFRADAQECAKQIDRINSSCGGVESRHARVSALGNQQLELEPRKRPVGGTIKNHLCGQAGVAPCPQETYRESSLYKFGFRLMAVALAAGLVVIAAYAPRAKAYEPKCDWDAALNLLASDRRFGKPITAGDDTAMRLAAMANLVPSKQTMLVPMFGATPEQLKLVILTCGPNETWTPRHFVVDVEAERRFYDHAPPNLPEPQEPKQRTRRGKQ